MRLRVTYGDWPGSLAVVDAETGAVLPCTLVKFEGRPGMAPRLVVDVLNFEAEITAEAEVRHAGPGPDPPSQAVPDRTAAEDIPVHVLTAIEHWNAELARLVEFKVKPMPGPKPESERPVKFREFL